MGKALVSRERGRYYVRPLTLPADTAAANVKGFDHNFPWQEKRKEL